MILFVGCSFTWGAGLEYEYLHFERGYSVERINKMIQSSTKLETLDDECVSYRKKHRYANLVGKKLNKNYKVLNDSHGNGGTNERIKGLLESNKNQKCNNCGFKDFKSDDLIVVQFTDWTRDIERKTGWKKLWSFNTEEIGEQIRKQIRSVCKTIGDDSTNWIGFSWTKDLGEELISLFPEVHIPIVLEDREVNSMEEMWLPEEYCQYNSRISDSILGCEDAHLNSEGHKIIANSILKKIENGKKI